MNGRKRRIIADTRGLTLEGQFPGQRLVWADGGYARKPVDRVREDAGCALEIVRRAKGERGFTVLPKRWVVEKALA